MEKQYGHGFTILKKGFNAKDDTVIQQMMLHCNKQFLCVNGDGNITEISKLLKKIYPSPGLVIKQVRLPKLSLDTWSNRLTMFFEILKTLQPFDPDVCFSRASEDNILFRDFINVIEI